MLIHVYKEKEKFVLNERIVAEKQQKSRRMYIF